MAGWGVRSDASLGFGAALVLAALVAGGCQAGEPTGVLVVIDAEPGVMSMTRVVSIDVKGGERLPQEVRGHHEHPTAGPDDWPVLVGLEPDGGDASRIWWLEIRALDADGGAVVVHRVQGGYEAGRVKVYRLTLTDSCIGETECAEMSPDWTCIDGACRVIRHIDASLLPDYQGGPVGGDGGMGDGGRDGGAPVDCTNHDECDDGDWCTTDRCTAGVCEQEPMVCEDDGDPCTAHRCDPTAESCRPILVDDGTACDGSGTCCGGACVNTDTDETSCGGCGIECGPNATCSGGTCECDPGFQDCDGSLGCESETMLDPSNCGGCGTVCSGGTPSCIAGSCEACGTGDDCSPSSLSCISDPSCVSGECRYDTLEPGYCLIGGVCRAEGLNPSNSCQECDPASSLVLWTPRTGVSCSDGDLCTTGDACNSSGACVGSDVDCSDSRSCLSGSCNAADGACIYDVTSGCLISGICWSSGEGHPTNECLECDPASSDTSWTPLTGSPCDDAQYCTTGDTCSSSGTCTGTTRPCGDGKSCTSDTCNESADRCDHAVTSGCLISDTCIASGTPRPGNECQSCQPSESTTSWSNVANGTSCSDGAGSCSSGVCQALDGGVMDAGDAGSMDASVGGG